MLKAIFSFIVISCLSCDPCFALDGQAIFTVDTNTPLTITNKKGTFIKVTGGEFKDGKLAGKFTAQLVGIDTDNNSRNADLHKKYLETDKFPEAKLELEPVTATGPFKGKLTFHGITKDVAGTVKMAPKLAQFSFKIADFQEFGVKQPVLDIKVGKIIVKETVDISVDLNL